MPVVDINISRKIYNDIYYPFIDDQTPTQIYYGGSSSGKSQYLSQRCIRDLLKGGRNYLVCRNTGKTLRGSVFTEIKKRINEYRVTDLFRVNKTDMTITCANGYQAILTGLDDVEKLKSIVPEVGVFTDVWVEEATETSADKVKLLKKRMRGRAKRSKRLVLSFNPILRSHWIAEKYFHGWADDDKFFKDDDVLIMKTTYKDNRFLDEDEIRDLENEEDEYLHAVYTLGNWGVLGDLIFKNWRVEDVLNSEEYKTFDIFKNGLDFGYSNDPTAFTQSYIHHASKRLYVCNEWFAKEITNPEIAEGIKPFLVNRDLVTCDSAEPKSIRELVINGINARGAVKGQGSILHGIQWLKQLDIIIDRSCQYTINNISAYHWKKTKDGEVLNIPVDRYNDFIDSIRYGCEDDMELNDIGDLMGVYGKAQARGV